MDSPSELELQRTHASTRGSGSTSPSFGSTGRCYGSPHPRSRRPRARCRRPFGHVLAWQNRDAQIQSVCDRHLAPERARLFPRGRAHTKPGTLLKSQIPIRTWAEWSENVPGFVEIDLVGHGRPFDGYLRRFKLVPSDGRVAMTEFYVASSLAHANEACLGQSPDRVCSREDRESRRHAVRRKVAIIGGSRFSGRTSSSK